MLYTEMQHMQRNMSVDRMIATSSLKGMLIGSLVDGRIMIPTTASVWPFYEKIVDRKFSMQADTQERQVRKSFIISGHFVYQIRGFPQLYWVNYVTSGLDDPAISFIVCKSSVIRL